MRQVSVIQPGARLHYAVPEIFARAGLLKCLYTDLHAEHRWLRALDKAIPSALKPKQLRRLLGRRLPSGICADRVNDMPFETLARYAAELIRLRQLGTHNLSKQILARVQASLWNEDDAIYTVLVNEDIETMMAVKKRGVRIIHECMIGPDVGLWVREERQLFKGIEEEEDLASIEAGRELDKKKYALADLILVPSDFAGAAVADLKAAPEKIKKIPYGLRIDKFATQTSNPELGRVLFVGSVGLRKGVQYLAAATRLLNKRAIKVDVRVVGPVSKHIVNHDVFAGPSYIGQIPRSELKIEYARADVFVLPTVCDSFALVHLEAMAAGLPVVTTPNCGSVVRDGIDGFIVPIRDPEAIAERVEQIVSDRDLRARMSENARARAKEYSIDRYGEHLLDAVKAVLV